MEKLPHLATVRVSEQKLYHGTPDEATVRCICLQNFDPRMHGPHGTVYGKGVYFSTTAKYSHQYTNPCPENFGRRFMFFGRVLVGKSALGRPEFQRPPPLDASRPHGTLYDSCVNSVSVPSIFVIFDNDQCYPEFLIEYEVSEKLETGRVGTLMSGSGATVRQKWASAAAVSASPHSSSSTRRTGAVLIPGVTASNTPVPATPMRPTSHAAVSAALYSLSSTGRTGASASPHSSSSTGRTGAALVPGVTARNTPDHATQVRPTSRAAGPTPAVSSATTLVNTVHSAVPNEQATAAPESRKGCVMM